MNKELKEQAHKEFDEKVNELKSAEFNSIGETAVFQFGYRLKDDNRFVWTIPDWGGIKSFIDSVIDETVQKTEERIVGKILNEETLQYKYPKINKKNTHFVKEVQLVKGYNWAIDRMRVVISDLITNKSDINK